jgi:hypothetical protein
MWDGGIGAVVEFLRKRPARYGEEGVDVPAWKAHIRIHECRDTVILQQHLTKLWVVQAGAELPSGTRFSTGQTSRFPEGKWLRGGCRLCRALPRSGQGSTTTLIGITD